MRGSSFEPIFAELGVSDEFVPALEPEEACERREYNGPKDIADLTRDSVIEGQGGECVGLAQIVGQCGSMKPNSKAPVNGLYLAGADAGAKGMGTHQSALSGTAVARMVQQCLRGRAKMR